MKDSPAVFSMGDPHGIGPEVLLRAVHESSGGGARSVIAGDPDYLRKLSLELEIGVDLDTIHFLSPGPYSYPPDWGKVAAKAGDFAWQCLNMAVEYCRAHESPLLVTAPVNKKALFLAGCVYPGQTEMVTSFFPTARSAMAFLSDGLKVLLITVHVPLREVAQLLKAEDLLHKTEIFLDALRTLGLQRPRLGLCGLNPHASEEGLFGDEEERILQPTVALVNRKHGPNTVSGPFPGDTLFRRALDGEFDGVIALYHDQGLIPLKLVAFESAVNVTLGLPLIRTSPDHGTAFDIAGQGKADSRSMSAAIRWGRRLCGVTSDAVKEV